MSDDPTKRLSNADEKLDQILSIVQGQQTQLDAVNTRLDHIEERQKELEVKVDARLHETRPIWELVLSRLTTIEARLTTIEARLTTIEERQQQMEQRLESMDRRVRWVYDEFKELKVRFRTVFNDVGKLLNDRDDFEERILKLETERSR
jgi:peptidoglycan hydrolase CwlO-like protein